MRGKSGRVVGAWVTLMTVVKGLPLAYNKDLQETQEPLYDAVETALATLAVATRHGREPRVRRRAACAPRSAPATSSRPSSPTTSSTKGVAVPRGARRRRPPRPRRDRPRRRARGAVARRAAAPPIPRSRPTSRTGSTRRAPSIAAICRAGRRAARVARRDRSDRRRAWGTTLGLMSGPFEYKNDELHCEDVPLATIAARGRHAGLRLQPRRARARVQGVRRRARGHARTASATRSRRTRRSASSTCSSSSAPAPTSCRYGELYRWQQAGGDPKKVVFSGVGKTEDEMQARARGRHRLRSTSSRGEELDVLDRVARARRQARADRAARQPRRRRRDPPVHLDRAQAEQVRHLDGRGARRSCRDGRASRPASRSSASTATSARS